LWGSWGLTSKTKSEKLRDTRNDSGGKNLFIYKGEKRSNIATFHRTKKLAGCEGIGGACL